MSDSQALDGFEYKNKNDETPFEVFLRYTDEKEKSSTKLASILQGILKQKTKILDIGTGNGEYLHLTLSKLKNESQYNLTLIEPSKDLAKNLHTTFSDLASEEQTQVISSSFADFESNDKFDVILASHLFYHIPRTDWPKELSKMLSMLRSNGYLIIILREKDDIYDFKTTFKPSLFKSFTKALLLNDVIGVLPSDTTIERFIATSAVRIPYLKNMNDAISIIEFFLNKPWIEIPTATQEAALHFVEKRQGILNQLDGIAVIKVSVQL